MTLSRRLSIVEHMLPDVIAIPPNASDAVDRWLALIHEGMTQQDNELLEQAITAKIEHRPRTPEQRAAYEKWDRCMDETLPGVKAQFGVTDLQMTAEINRRVKAGHDLYLDTVRN